MTRRTDWADDDVRFAVPEGRGSGGGGAYDDAAYGEAGDDVEAGSGAADGPRRGGRKRGGAGPRGRRRRGGFGDPPG
ncbi:recombination regulator RecX, partial [Streptomyces sp. NPDC001661]